MRARLHPLLPLESDTEIDPEVAGAPEQLTARVRAVEWLLSALAAQAPVLLVVEDAERLSEEESNLLAALATRLPERTLVAVCFRDPPGSRHPPLADLLGRGGVYELTRLVSLEALDREDLGELVASMHQLDAEVPPAFVDELWHRTAGNPFFAREVLRDVDPADVRSGRLGQGLPAGLRGVLRHRLGQLPPDTRSSRSSSRWPRRVSSTSRPSTAAAETAARVSSGSRPSRWRSTPRRPAGRPCPSRPERRSAGSRSRSTSRAKNGLPAVLCQSASTNAGGTSTSS